jgi:hypothetical protein
MTMGSRKRGSIKRVSSGKGKKKEEVLNKYN